MNAFCAWLHAEGHARERVKLAKLRVERRLLTLLDDAQMRALIGYKPRTFRQARVQLAALLILDTGLRISEALNLRDGDIDFDNLVVKVFGKGQKERFVPFSPELRRRIFRYQQLRASEGVTGEFLFVGFEGTRWEKRNSTTSLYRMQDHLNDTYTSLRRISKHRISVCRSSIGFVEQRGREPILLPPHQPAPSTRGTPRAMVAAAAYSKGKGRGSLQKQVADRESDCSTSARRRKARSGDAW